MFNHVIKAKQPFAARFLESVLTPGKEKLANAYMFTGSSIMDMYFLALETARILNCHDKTENCACSSCSWIRQNRHPTVITISPIDYIHANKDGKPKTVITIEQARHLKQSLSISSQYHRVIIFTDALEGKEHESKADKMWKEYQEFITPPVLEAIAGESKQRTSWIPMPLNYKNFHSGPANTMLKIIEEPPPKTTFFFFAKDREDMLDTIVSRSQIIPLVYTFSENSNLSVLDDFFKYFPPESPEDSVLYSEKLIQIAKENSLPLEDLFNLIQEYLILEIKQNLPDKNFCKKNINYLKNIQHAGDELKNYVNPQAIADSLLLNMTV
ncbi:MAG: hypothetical protein KAQ92_01390 [Candidatus Aenigmarchaeota archaeon]|nr:hypothetical protein [Candidatus Aenigmarchaeota archaeon]